MLNLDRDDEKKIVYGTLIGSAIAIAALSIYCASKRHNKHSSLHIIGSTIAHIVDKLEDGREGAHKAIHEMEEKIEDKETMISDFFELASVGMSLWKKLKKGK